MSKSTIRSKPSLAVTAALASALLFAGGAQANDIDIRLGLIFSPAVPSVRCGAIPMAEDEHLKDLGINITVIHSAQLGGENDMAQQVSSGQLEMSSSASSILASWVEGLAVFETYYLYDSVDQAFAVYETETAGELFAELLEVADIRVLGLPWLYGERHVFGNRPLRSPEDFVGLRMRVPETSVSIAGARSLGASPTPTAYAELYLALQQGIVDAAEAPAAVARAESFYEPADYFNVTRHLISAAPTYINERVWQSMTAEQQDALEQAVADAALRVRACTDEADAEAYAYWRESGTIEIVEDVDREALRANSRAFFSEGFPWSDIYSGLIEQLAE